MSFIAKSVGSTVSCLFGRGTGRGSNVRNAGHSVWRSSSQLSLQVASRKILRQLVQVYRRLVGAAAQANLQELEKAHFRLFIEEIQRFRIFFSFSQQLGIINRLLHRMHPAL